MVQKLKPHLSPLAPIKPKLPPKLRKATCGECKWLLAAETLEDLFSVGWIIGKMKETTDNDGELFAFICRTCAGEPPTENDATAREYLARTRGPSLFALLPDAPDDACPAVGGVGKEHELTSRPVDN